MIEGTIRWWNHDRGWGFAAVKDNPDVFVHHASYEGDGDLRAGERIHFDLVSGYLGGLATNVVRP